MEENGIYDNGVFQGYRDIRFNEIYLVTSNRWKHAERADHHEHRLDAWRKELAFLQRYLDPEYGRSITSTQDIVLDKQ